MLSAPTARSFPAGAGISRCLRLTEPVPFVCQQKSLVVCSQSLPGPRAGPGPGEGKGWSGTRTAAIQQLGTNSEAAAAKAGRERGETRPARPRRQSSQRRRAASGACPAPCRSPRWTRRRERAPCIPARRPALCPSSARCNAGPRAGAFKEATKPVPARLQPGDPAGQSRGSLTLGRLYPGANGERDKRRAYVSSPTSHVGKGRVKESDSCSKPPPVYTHFSVGSGNMFQGRWRFLAPLLRQPLV